LESTLTRRHLTYLRSQEYKRNMYPAIPSNFNSSLSFNQCALLLESGKAQFRFWVIVNREEGAQQTFNGDRGRVQA